MNLDELMKLVDEYAELRCEKGLYAYNLTTSLKRKELEEVLDALVEDANFVRHDPYIEGNT